MHPEIQSFTTIWLIAVASMIFCHEIAARITAGAARLVSLLPVFYLLTVLPLRLSSVHLAGPTVFYLVWLANSKLLLFSFNQGPLSTNPPLSLLHFVSIALLPIRTAKHTASPKPSPSNRGTNCKPILVFLLKSGLLALIVCLYSYRDFMHPYLILSLYCCNVYLGVELVLAVTAEPVRAALGLEVEPPFDEPYKATSLRDFWGRRWNLVAGGVLRATVYDPVRRLAPARWGAAPAIAATFLVSGLMHEAIYYYLTRASPTWEVTRFFVLHGACVAAEVGARKLLAARGGGGLWGARRAAARAMTVGFVAATGGWLFFPQMRRNGVDARAIDEYWVLVGFVREKLRLVRLTFSKSCTF